MKHRTIVCTVPTWALGYLMNDNPEGLDERELDLCKKFLTENKIIGGLIDIKWEPFLSRRNDIDRHSGECVTLRCATSLAASDMFDLIVCPVSLKYGAPLGRANRPPASWEDVPCFDRKVPLDSGGYDKHGAYWGLGGELRLRISKDFQYWEFYRK